MSWAEEQDWFGLEDLVVEDKQRNIELLNNHLWETKEGNIIKISDMSDSHIKYSINKIIKENWRTEYLPLLKKEQIKRKNKCPL